MPPRLDALVYIQKLAGGLMSRQPQQQQVWVRHALSNLDDTRVYRCQPHLVPHFAQPGQYQHDTGARRARTPDMQSTMSQASVHAHESHHPLKSLTRPGCVDRRQLESSSLLDVHTLSTRRASRLERRRLDLLGARPVDHEREVGGKSAGVEGEGAGRGCVGRRGNAGARAMVSARQGQRRE